MLYVLYIHMTEFVTSARSVVVGAVKAPCALQKASLTWRGVGKPAAQHMGLLTSSCAHVRNYVVVAPWLVALKGV
jgi:hypothetical protein